MYDHSLENAAYEWEMMKSAADQKFTDRSLADLGRGGLAGAKKMTGYRDIKKGLEMTRAARDFAGGLTPDQIRQGGNFAADSKAFKGMSKAEQQAALLERIQLDRKAGGAGGARGAYLDRKAGRRLLMRGGGKAALTLGAGTAAVMGARSLMKKKSSYDPMVEAVEDLEGWEFAKEAELRAAEILLANGVDPETFEETYPEHVKLASFPDPEDAHTYEGEGALEAYNEMLDDAALDIIEELGLI